MIKIGITYLGSDPFRRYMQKKYTDSLKAAGAKAVLLKQSEDNDVISRYATDCDAFVFPGGADLSPSLYGEEPLPECGKSYPERDNFEVALLNEVMRLRKPILSICRGAQLVNVALGGTLYQDIKSQLPEALPGHMDFWRRKRGSHPIIIEKDSRIFDIFGEKAYVNSMHHQAIKEPANYLRPVAKSADGIIEALEYPAYPYFVAVQWHPEHMAASDPKQAALFKSFVEESAKIKEGVR
ncbi:MAG TPA: gamma-glutamyl-gamma-aminobutyrate hydrolase family protein [Clostridiales bacterium]|nr:gamma-glutamyl-gamma-aminobutyrate hydrolase family protein [Clostridiales bacterium]